MKRIFVLFALILALAGSSAGLAATATAVISGTQPGSSVGGKVTFMETSEGLHVRANVSGASAGKHGFHIHEVGSCADSGKAAGGHFNPDKMDHGFLPKDGIVHAHAGDLGNITADAGGSGELDLMIPSVTLADGPYAIAGRSVILHEKEDDFGQPVGNAGGRIGCGIITLDE
ncbi:MAG: superoxide dismutase family protein [Candidatus Omnitrophica bacterium]|nr:superoxide dismutase family protein [Candidatus Omnitrophota bacterium]